MKKRIFYLILFVFAFTTVNAQINSVAIVGAGVGGWPGSEGNPGPIDLHQMTKIDDNNWEIDNIYVSGPGIKFRANNSWDDATLGGGNWGPPDSGEQWPNGKAINAMSSTDIKIGVVPGTYIVLLNTKTNEYSFKSNDSFLPKVKITGSAINGGELSMSNTSFVDLEVRSTFLEGTAQFDVNGKTFSNSAFPEGLAIEGGPPIPVPAGEWIVHYNSNTGLYNFSPAQPVFPVISILGSAVGGWDMDTDLTTTDGQNYFIKNINIIDGEVKFRQDYNSEISWGDPTSSTGNIFVTAGTYIINFNRITGIYSFTSTNRINSVAIVGSGIEADGWPGATNNPGPVDKYQMTSTDGEYWKIDNLTLVGGGVKFRANNAWNGAGYEWAGSFPSGIGTSVGDINAIAGTYNVKLNTTTGAYSFEGGPLIPKVIMIGSAVVNNELSMQTNDGINFTIQASFLAGTAKFDVAGILLSDKAFPNGSAFEGGSSIPILTGTYNVTFDLSTGFYVFKFPVISITGSAVGSWGINTDLTTTDGNNYYINSLTIADGEVRFLQDYNSEISWGDPTSASGNIVVNAGTYDITFIPSGTIDFGRTTGKGIWTFRDAATKALVFTNNPALSTKGFSTANFKVSPNPATNNWNFTTANDSIESIQILDVLGKNVMSISPRGNTANIDASSLTRGIYFAKVATAKASQTLKLMKN